MKLKSTILIIVCIATAIIVNIKLTDTFQKSKISYDKIKRPVLIKNTQTTKSF